MKQLSNIGIKIAQLRRSHGMTQEELGKRVSVSAQAVSKWEHSDSLPDLPLIVELANIFDCTTDYLLGREGGLSSLLPQIRETFVNMTPQEKIGFLGEIITAAEASKSASPLESKSHGHPSLVHIHLGPTGIGLRAKDRLVCIATSTFMNEAVETIRNEAKFPFTLIPDEIRSVVLSLLRDMDDLKPDYAVDEKTLRSFIPNNMNLEHILSECIELGFVDRVRGGYRLNFEADLAIRLLAMIHQSINKKGTVSHFYLK